MVKISIALPNHAEINLEAEDTEQLLPVVNLVRQELLRDVASLAAPANGATAANGAVPSVSAPPLPASDEPAKPAEAPTPAEIPAPSPTTPGRSQPGASPGSGQNHPSSTTKRQHYPPGAVQSQVDPGFRRLLP